MDSTMQKLTQLSKQYNLSKNEFIEISVTLKNTFKLSNEQESLVSFGILETASKSLQKYVDILNNDTKLNKLYDEFSKFKLDGIIIILEFALKCGEEISGYDLNMLLKNPSKNINEITSLFEGLAGVQHIHIIDGKIMLEIPACEYVIKNKRLLKYVDFWTRELGKCS